MTRLLALLFVVIVQFGSSQEPLTMCSPNNLIQELVCNCTTHDSEWCDADRPPTTCCRTHNEGTAQRCGCCAARSAGLQRWAGKACQHG